jgi:hypothetical protein
VSCEIIDQLSLRDVLVEVKSILGKSRFESLQKGTEVCHKPFRVTRYETQLFI